MDVEKARELVVEAGNRLVSEDLVARTWGNVSCKIDDTHYAITPSGITYADLTEEDIPIFDMETGKWEGKYKPSSEKKIHTAAYGIFPECGAVVHTHQVYASAFSIAGFHYMKMTKNERALLGGVALAAYGLPGSDALTRAVEDAFLDGAHTVLMAHHGAIFLGETMEEAFERALLFEQICKRNARTEIYTRPMEAEYITDAFMTLIKEDYPNAILVDTPHVCACANKGDCIRAELDDMAQMIGAYIPVLKRNNTAVVLALKKHHAVMVKGMGVIVNDETPEDARALSMIVDKAAVCKIHAILCGEKATLPLNDVIRLRHFYLRKYSKQKKN